MQIAEVHDRLDLLALDPDGNAVIIELKRGLLHSPFDFQSLRYASYISRWHFDDFEAQARSRLGNSKPEFNFAETYSELCREAGRDETPEINVDQRIIIVGSGIHERLVSVAHWLRQRGVDIKVVQAQLYRDQDRLLAQPLDHSDARLANERRQAAISEGRWACKL